MSPNPAVAPRGAAIGKPLGGRKPRLPLPHITKPQQPPAPTAPNDTLLVCSPPTTRTGPAFEILLRRPILLQEAGDGSSSPADIYSNIRQAVPFAGASYHLRDVYFGLDARFSQVWNLKDVTIGDLASTMSLAPREQLTIEILTSQRKVLEQSTLDSTEAISSSESTTSDKETVNVVRGASKTEGWHVDGTGTLTCGYGSASVSAGYSKSVTESNQQTINHVTEATKKSATNLKALHKIDVRGVSESFVQNRMTRVLKNPYYDRTLSVNVFQLLKQFSVQTDLVDLRGGMIFRIDAIDFNSDFILNHVDFLRNTLVDAALVDNLPSAIQGAKPTIQSGARDTAIAMSKLALRYLFNTDEPESWSPKNIQNLPSPDNATSGNDPQESFQQRQARAAGNPPPGLGVGDITLGILSGGATLVPTATADAYINFMKKEAQIQGASGFDTAVRSKSSSLFVVLPYFNAVVREPGLLDIGDNAILFAMALANELQLQWDKLYPDPIKSDELQVMMSSANFTEVFRRVPGFVAMIREIVRPLVEPAGADSQAIAAHNQDVFTLARLIAHLSAYSAYYTERFLHYVAQATNNQAIVDFAVGAMANVVFSFDFDPNDFDLERTFLVRREIVVPGLAPLDDKALSRVGVTLGATAEQVALPVPSVENVETPCDGVHFEVAPGLCVLKDVPVETPTVEFNLQGASLKAAGG